MAQKISSQIQLLPSRLPLLELLDKVETTRESSRSMFENACRLEGRTLVVPGRVFCRTYCKADSPFEAAFVDGRILLVGKDPLGLDDNSTLRPSEERRLELPLDFPLDKVQQLLTSAVVFVGRQSLLIGTAQDVPSRLGRHRRVRAAPSTSAKTFQEDRVTYCQTQFDVTREAVVGWRQAEHSESHIRTMGGPLSVLGWAPDDTLRMTVHPNGVLLERCAAALATTTLKASRNDPAGICGRLPSIYVNKKYFRTADAGSRFVAMVVGASLFLVPETPEVMALCAQDLGLHASLRMGHRFLERTNVPRPSARGVVWRIGEFHFVGLPRRARAARAGSTGNSAVYGAPAVGGRLQLQGDWLRDFGFVPGARYRAIPAGQITSGPCLELCDEGEYTVTALTKGGSTPKMYVPAKLLQDWRERMGPKRAKFQSIRVAGTALGLALVPR